MKKLIIASAMIAGLTGTAIAQEAFITQVGANNSAANVATNEAIQAIQQNGNNLTAVQLSRGVNNKSYTYQGGNLPPVSGGRGSTALTIQTTERPNGNGFAGSNTAVTVQGANGEGANNGQPLTSQILQAGKQHVAINYQDAAIGVVPTSIGALATPTISVSQPGILPVPAAQGTVNFPSKSTVTTAGPVVVQ